MIRRVFLGMVILVGGYAIYARYFGVCGEDVYVTIAPLRYCVPRELSQYEQSLLPLNLLPGFGGPQEGEGSLILFSRLEYKKAVAGYEIERDINNQPIIEDLVLISPLSEEEIGRYKYGGSNKYFQDLWFSEGQWSESWLEPVGRNGWYRAYWLPGGNSWQVVREKPSRESGNYLQPGFAIALCHYTVRERKTCSVTYLDEEHKLLIDLDLDEENLDFRNEIGAYIAKRLESWEIGQKLE